MVATISKATFASKTYTTGNDSVTVQYTYKRTVENSSFYYPASGEKVFHIPDIQNKTDEEVKIERKFNHQMMNNDKKMYFCKK